MTKSTSKKLSLRKISLRRLDDTALEQAAGGATWGNCTNTSVGCTDKSCMQVLDFTRYINPNPVEQIVIAPIRTLGGR